jgi:hypothetical protein
VGKNGFLPVGKIVVDLQHFDSKVIFLRGVLMDAPGMVNETP